MGSLWRPHGRISFVDVVSEEGGRAYRQDQAQVLGMTKRSNWTAIPKHKQSPNTWPSESIEPGPACRRHATILLISLGRPLRTGITNSRSISHTTPATFPPRLALQQSPHLLSHRIRRVRERERSTFVDYFFCRVGSFDTGESGVL